MDKVLEKLKRLYIQNNKLQEKLEFIKEQIEELEENGYKEWWNPEWCPHFLDSSCDCHCMNSNCDLPKDMWIEEYFEFERKYKNE